MEELSLMERFADPALYPALTSAEKLEGGLVTTLVGMGVTFTVLILIWAVIALMTRIINGKKPQQIKEVKTVTTSPSVDPPTSVIETGTGPELIAVIMAAIAATEGTAYINNLLVRKISRISGNRPTWGMAGTVDSIESRKF